jgi:hypothetical protein
VAHEPEDLQMLNSGHYRRRAERLRLALLLTPNPIDAVRLRDFVERYRVLAVRTERNIASPSLDPAEEECALTEESVD